MSHSQCQVVIDQGQSYLTCLTLSLIVTLVLSVIPWHFVTHVSHSFPTYINLTLMIHFILCKGSPFFSSWNNFYPLIFTSMLRISVYVLTCLLLVNFELLSSNIAAICKKIFKTKLFFGNDYPPSPLSLTDMIEGGNFPKSCIVNNIVMLLTVSF